MRRALADERQRVPQTSSLLPARRQAGGCRGFPIRKVWVFSNGFGFVQGPADWKSAIRQVRNLRHNLAEFARRSCGARRETVKTVELLSRTLITLLKRGVNGKGTCERAPARAADFQSAVSRISNPQGLGIFQWFRVCPGPCRLEVGDTAG